MNNGINDSDNLQVGNTYRQIWKIALPVSFAILIPQLNFIINNIFLGHYDKQALAVAGITGVYYLIFAAFGFGLNNGLQALIARRAGENRTAEIGKLFNQGILITVIIASFSILVTWLVTPTLFGWFIHDQERLEEAVLFSKIRIWGLYFLYIYQMRNALLVGTNQSRYLIAGAIAEAFANILFDYLLIFGHAGFPEMGLNGAAVSSIIAEFAGMFAVFRIIRQKGISKRFQLWQKLRWDKQNFRLIAKMSSPLIFQHAISIMSWEYFFLLMDSYGETALAISNIMRNIFGISGIIIWSFAATANTMVSNIIGQQRDNEVWPLLGRIIRLNMGCILVIVVLINIFPAVLPAIYGQGDQFIGQSIPVIRIVSGAILLMSVSTVFLHAVTGSGNTRITLFIEVFAIIFYCIYIYLIIVHYRVPMAVSWTGEWLYWTLILVPAFLYMRSGKWKGKRI